MISKKSIALIQLFCISVILSLGCNSQPIQPDRTQPIQPVRILSEITLRKLPGPWWTFHPRSSEYYRYYGVKLHHIQKIWEGVKMLRVTLMEKGEDYIFEIQCAGDIERARKKYGNRMLFHITGIPGYQIFTTGFMNEAVLVERETINVSVTENEKGELVSAKMIWPLKEKEVARLDVKIDGDKIRIYLPGKYPQRGRSGLWLENKPESFGWTVQLRLAVEPGKPIPSSIKNVFYAPMVYFIHYPPGRRLWLPEELWGTKQVRD